MIEERTRWKALGAKLNDPGASLEKGRSEPRDVPAGGRRDVEIEDGVERKD
jgi:hypothetical protein